MKTFVLNANAYQTTVKITNQIFTSGVIQPLSPGTTLLVRRLVTKATLVVAVENMHRLSNMPHSSPKPVYLQYY